jgi:phage replication-related protein YjqB (UPF0714/DUF867 family)
MKMSTTARRHDASRATRAKFNGSVKKAFDSQSTLLKKPEHCSLDPERLAAIGLVLGSQIRVRLSSEELALYTVSETRQETPDTTVRMALVARRRLRAPDEFDATIDSEVPHPTLSDEEAQACSEFVERLDDDGCQQGLVALAPHGGSIERHTDQQAERVRSLLGGSCASAWRCKGFKAGGGALERWHITATEIHEASFPLLRTIVTRGFVHAVAFHGFDKSDVLVGGAAPPALKEEIAIELKKALFGSGILARVADASDNLDGDSPSNIVNRLTAGGKNGLQIEQSLAARNAFWEPIAHAVASVYRRKLHPAC